MKLRQITSDLNKELEQLKQIYNENKFPDNKRDKAFFSFVKEKTNPIYNQLHEWETEALEQGKKRNIFVYPHQIASTRENMELILMHSYYHDVRKKRYMELYQSIQYIFEQIIRELNVIDNQE